MSIQKSTPNPHPLKNTEPFHPSYSNPEALFYSVEVFDTLSKIEDATRTRQLVKKTSLKIVKCGIRVFRIMRQIESMITPLKQEDIEKAAKILGINRFPQEGPDKTLPTPSRGTILRLILERDPYQARRIAFGQFQKPGYRPPDMSRHILIFYLREHLKACTRKPNNEVISGFLFEQDLGDVSANWISKTPKKISAERLQEAYEFYREVYETPILSTSNNLDDLMARIQGLNRIAVDHPTDMRDTTLFPSWKNYLPEITK